jgi:DNA-binding SARP family transcriptional activator
METVFDHDPSAEELKYLFLTGKTREEYIASHEDQETEYGNIYALYMIRGNRDKALEYLNRIRNPKARFNSKPPEPN